MFCVAVATVEAGEITRQQSARLFPPNIEPELVAASGVLWPLLTSSVEDSCPAVVYCSPVANVVVSSGAFAATFHVPPFVADEQPPLTVFEEPNTACSANWSAPTADDDAAIDHALPLAASEFWFVNSFQRSVMPPESFVTVAELGDSSSWFATPVHATVYVDEFAASTATDSAVLNVTSMFRYDDVFAADAVPAKPADASSAVSAAPSFIRIFIRFSPVSDKI